MGKVRNDFNRAAAADAGKRVDGTATKENDVAPPRDIKHLHEAALKKGKDLHEKTVSSSDKKGPAPSM